MGYNPLANKPGAVKPPVKKPMTAQEAIAEMLRNRSANPTQAPTLPPRPVAQPQKVNTLAQSLIEHQSPGASQNIGGFQKLSAPATPEIKETNYYSGPSTPQVKETNYKPDYGQFAGQMGTNAAVNYGVDAAIGGSAPSAPVVLEAGVGAAPSTPVIAGAQTIPVSQGGAGAVYGTGSPSMFAAGGPVLQGAGIAAGAGTGYLQGSGVYNAAQNKDMSLAEQTALALPTFGLSYAFNPIKHALGGKKDQDQQRRDHIRDNLIQAGISDDAYNINGVDIGKDGGFLLENGLHPYDVDFNKEGAGQTVANINPLAAIMAAEDGKGTSDAAGLLFNSIGDDREKLLAAYDKVGGHDGAYATINQMAADGILPRETADAYLNGLDQLFGVGAYGSPSSGASTGGRKKSKGKGSSKSDDKPVTPIAPTPPPTDNGPQTKEPVSGDDYVQAINAVNEANSVNKKQKRKNNLANGFYS